MDRADRTSSVCSSTSKPSRKAPVRCDRLPQRSRCRARGADGGDHDIERRARDRQARGALARWVGRPGMAGRRGRSRSHWRAAGPRPAAAPLGEDPRVAMPQPRRCRCVSRPGQTDPHRRRSRAARRMSGSGGGTPRGRVPGLLRHARSRTTKTAASALGETAASDRSDLRDERRASGMGLASSLPGVSPSSSSWLQGAAVIRPRPAPPRRSRARR